jgi:predicted transposase YdaD
MAIAPEERARVKLECLRLLATLQLDPGRTRLISGFVDTYLRLNAHETAQFRAELAQTQLQEQEVVMEIVTSWMLEGLQQGRQQGKQEEALALVLRLLQRRVGPMDAAYEEQLRRLSLEALEELSEALLDFTQVADVVTWLQAHQAPS